MPPVADDRLLLTADGRPYGFRDGHGHERRFMTMPVLDAATCAGYASHLPEVAEVVLSYPQWKERTLTEWLGGEPPTPPLLHCLASLEAGKNQNEAARIERQRAEAEANRGR